MTAAVALLCVVGCISALSGAVGVLRLPDVYARVQASTKNVTLGAVPVLVAVVVARGVVSTFAARALLVTALVLLVNPAASHALVRAAWKTGVSQWDGAIGARTSGEEEER